MTSFKIEPATETVVTIKSHDTPFNVVDAEIVHMLMSKRLMGYVLVLERVNNPVGNFPWTLRKWFPEMNFIGVGYLVEIPPEAPDLTLDIIYREVDFL